MSIFNIAELSAFRTREVVLPRFKLEQSYDLIENLQELGLTDLFNESGDFSEMTSEKVSMNWVSLKPSSCFSTTLSFVLMASI